MEVTTGAQYLVRWHAGLHGTADYLGTTVSLSAPMYGLLSCARSPRNRRELRSGIRTGSKLSYEDFAEGLDRMIACAPTCEKEQPLVAMFFDYGLYAKHLRQFYAVFEHEQILVMRSEDFFATPVPYVQQILEFFGVSALPSFIEATQASQDKHDRNSGKLWGGDSYSGKLLQRERKKLNGFFHPHNLELYTLIGRDMEWEKMGDEANRTL